MTDLPDTRGSNQAPAAAADPHEAFASLDDVLVLDQRFLVARETAIAEFERR